MNDQVCRSTPREDPDRIVGTLLPARAHVAARWFCQGGLVGRSGTTGFSFPGPGKVHAVAAVALSVNSARERLEQKAGVEPYHEGFVTILPNWLIRIFPPR